MSYYLVFLCGVCVDDLAAVFEGFDATTVGQEFIV